MWFDSHCHLYDIGDRRQIDAALARARAAGITGMLVPGVDPETSERALGLTAHDGVFAAAAYHPSEVKGWSGDWLAPIDSLLGEERVVAVGETGLDFYRDTSYVDDQKNAFSAHIALAAEHDKALVIHTRNSVAEALDMLETARPPRRFVFHCWSGDGVQLTRAVGLSAFVSFAGNVTYKNADDLRAAAAAVPSERLLVETDSPYLAPVPHRGRPNEPAHLVHVGEAIAAARGESLDAIARLTRDNALRLFGLRP